MSTCEVQPLRVSREIGSVKPEPLDQATPRLQRRAHWLSPRILFACVFIGGLIARLIRWGMNSPLWGDEAMVVHSLLDRTAADLFKPLDYIQIAPLGFLWGELTCFRWFGSSEWAWRLLPTVAGCASLLYFSGFARRVLPKHGAWLATAIVASSVYLVRHSVEAKPYIWDFAFALALMQFGWRIHERPDRLLRWLAFGLLAAFSVWCSFPSAFAAGGILISLIPVLSGPLRRKLFAAWLLCGITLTASFLAMYYLFGRVQVQTANEAGYWQFSMWEVAFPPWHRPDQLVWWLIREHSGAMMAHPFGGKNFASLGTLLLVISGAITLSRRNPRLLGMLLAPAALGFLAACLQKYPYGGTARTMLYLAPAICLLAGLGGWAVIVRVVAAAKRRTVLRIVLLSCLGLIVAKCGLEIAQPYKQYADWQVRETVERWAVQSAPDDIWVIANAATTPDRTDRGIYGGITVAVFDHYTQIHAAKRATYPRHIADFPETSGRVMLLVHESLDWPLTKEVGDAYRDSFLQQANLNHEDTVDLEGRETLRMLVFTPRR